MRILHLADVHLDRPFVGLPGAAAASQRRNLFAAFCRGLAVGREHGVELLTIGGDLWEEEHVRADTRASVAHELGQLDVPVLIVCGNHDPLLPGGSYSRTAWPDNVQVAPIRNLHEFRFGDVSIWSVSWGGGDLSSRVLDHFDSPDDGRVHLALLHGTAPTAPFADEADGYFPFDPQLLRRAGISACLAGHIHAASYANGVVYPGSPEPLGWGEHGRHCVAVVDVGAEVAVDLIDVNRTRFETREIDCSGCASSAGVEERIKELLGAGDENVFVRAKLVGEVGPDCEVDVAHAGASRRPAFAALQIEDATEPSLDVESRVERKSLDGLFTRKLLEQIDAAPDERAGRIARLALEAGLRAIEGREAVLRVG
jgi:DNA repair exonuclease SbcCD nuclease subunit